MDLSAYEYAVDCWMLLEYIDGLIAGTLDTGVNGTIGGHFDASEKAVDRGLNRCRLHSVTVKPTFVSPDIFRHILLYIYHCAVLCCAVLFLCHILDALNFPTCPEGNGIDVAHKNIKHKNHKEFDDLHGGREAKVREKHIKRVLFHSSAVSGQARILRTLRGKRRLLRDSVDATSDATAKTESESETESETADVIETEDNTIKFFDYKHQQNVHVDAETPTATATGTGTGSDDELPPYPDILSYDPCTAYNLHSKYYSSS